MSGIFWRALPIFPTIDLESGEFIFEALRCYWLDLGKGILVLLYVLNFRERSSATLACSKILTSRRRHVFDTKSQLFIHRCPTKTGASIAHEIHSGIFSDTDVLFRGH